MTDVIGFGQDETDVRKFSAALEAGSSHSLAGAILASAAEKKISRPHTTDATALGGKEVAATVEGKAVFLGSLQAAQQRATLSSDETITTSVLVGDGEAAGVIALRDEPRPDALAGIKALTDTGVRTVMLTGDNQRTATAICKQLGIESGPHRRQGS